MANATVEFDADRPAASRAPAADIRVKSFPGEASPLDHVVQFYDSEDFLRDTVAQFLGGGLATGAPALVIATAGHRALFRGSLETRAFDLVRAQETMLFTDLDAQQTLSRFMVTGMPDAARFRAVVGSTIAMVQERHPGQRIRAYGEMVDLLWRSGQREAALRLEEMWNDLGRDLSFSLLCAYSIRGFEQESDTAALQAVCHAHSKAVPTESYADIATEDGRLREITLLQQRAVALEHEVAQRRRLETQLRDALERETGARAEAERAVHYNQMFAGMLGHDLRNPLNAILTTAHYLSRSSGDAKTTAAATRIASSSNRMARMIEQLLDFTKIRVGDGLAIQPLEVDLAELCRAVQSELEGSNPGCTITLRALGDTVGRLDPDRMMQVLSNVVGNAAHHGEAGCAVTVTVDGTDTNELRLIVRNGGVVPPDVMPVLFEPFRAVTKGQRTRGLGLGLYITRQIVAAHEGAIEVESSADHGTTFRITLPRDATCSPS